MPRGNLALARALLDAAQRDGFQQARQYVVADRHHFRVVIVAAHLVLHCHAVIQVHLVQVAVLLIFFRVAQADEVNRHRQFGQVAPGCEFRLCHRLQRGLHLRQRHRLRFRRNGTAVQVHQARHGVLVDVLAIHPFRAVHVHDLALCVLAVRDDARHNVADVFDAFHRQHVLAVLHHKSAIRADVLQRVQIVVVADQGKAIPCADTVFRVKQRLYHRHTFKVKLADFVLRIGQAGEAFIGHRHAVEYAVNRVTCACAGV